MLDSLLRVDDTDSYHRINELEDWIEVVMKQGQMLAGLMTKGCLQLVYFNKEK